MTANPASPDIHPFLKGNFAPVTEEYISSACQVTGRIPDELLGGQYIRNGGNPVYPPEKGRHYHWFDGDGMLHGVLFPIRPDDPPLYTNRHLATPLLTLTLLLLRSPIPSIALLISPLSSLHRIVAAIMQSFFLLLRARMGVLSVANTSVVWWGQGLGLEAKEEDAVLMDLGATPAGTPMVEVDKSVALGAEGKKRPAGPTRTKSTLRAYRRDHRLLATCESGPPLEVRVPELETVAWDRLEDRNGEHLGQRRGKWEWWRKFGLSRVQEDWMTAHPRVDPIDGSLIFYSCQMFDAPHARYSVIDRKGRHLVWKEGIDIGRAKMMHDFACTRSHTILLNLPLTLAPANLFSMPPVPLIHFDRSLHSEFVIFPRLLNSAETPQQPIRFVDPEPSLIFHTANAWDEVSPTDGRLEAVNMLGCRFRSAKLVYAAGAVEVPLIEDMVGRDDVVRLHYYRFAMPSGYGPHADSPTSGEISHSFPLSIIPFEFPSTHPDMQMSDARFVYGCTMRAGSFDERLGGAAKVDCIVKLDVRELIARGRKRGEGRNMEPVDARPSAEILRDYQRGERGGPIEIFSLPERWYAQEPRFVPRNPVMGGVALDEDDGYLLSYVYDESFLLADGTPSVAPGAGSELWVIDAKRLGEGMSAVVARVKLPQRVPYGLHGTYLPPSMTRHQRELSEPVPGQPLLQEKLALSRIQQFASIVFHRPSERSMSRFERAVLAVLWPAAVGFLGLAISEVIRTALEALAATRQLSGEGALAPRNGSLFGGLGMADTAQAQLEGSVVPTNAASWITYLPQAISLSLVLITIIVRIPKGKTPARAESPPLQEI